MQNFTNSNSSFGGDLSGFSFANNMIMDGSDQLQNNSENSGVDVSALSAYLQNSQGNVNWTTCNHCQQLFANNAYAEHEASCPMRL
jgi:acyl CoA:acetate/3-ketoacid CoA transferase